MLECSRLHRNMWGHGVGEREAPPTGEEGEHTGSFGTRKKLNDPGERCDCTLRLKKERRGH